MEKDFISIKNQFLYFINEYPILYWIFQLFYNIYYFLMVLPLWWFYRYGFHFYGIGGWAGASNHDICSILTNTKSEMWKETTKDIERCQKLIDERFDVIVLSFLIILYFIFMIYCLNSFLRNPFAIFQKINRNKILTPELKNLLVEKDKELLKYKNLLKNPLYSERKRIQMDSHEKGKWIKIYNNNQKINSSSPLKFREQILNSK